MSRRTSIVPDTDSSSDAQAPESEAPTSPAQRLAIHLRGTGHSAEAAAHIAEQTVAAVLESWPASVDPDDDEVYRKALEATDVLE